MENTNTDTRPYLTADEIVDLGIFGSKAALHLARRQNGFPSPAKVSHKRAIYARSEVEAWLQEKRGE